MITAKMKWKVAVVILAGTAATASAVLFVVRDAVNNRPNI